MEVTDTAVPDEYMDEISTDDKSSHLSRSKLYRDSGYHRMCIGKRDNGKPMYVEFYDSTSTMGASIRSAITGLYMFGHKVGSHDEHLYFKVVSTTHPPNSKGDHHPCHLYYESPEQWERHFRIRCREDVKTAWREKYERAILRKMKHASA